MSDITGLVEAVSALAVGSVAARAVSAVLVALIGNGNRQFR